MNKKRLQIILFFLIAVINISFVLAENYLEPAFDALTNLGILETVAKYPIIWDAILFSWLFMYVGRNVLGKRIGPQGGTIVGLILGISLISGEIAFGFSLIENFGPWVLVGASIAVIFWLVRILFGNEEGGKFGSMALGIFLITSILLYGFPTLGEMIKNTSGFLYGMIVVINTLAMIGAMIWLIRFIFPGRGGAGATGSRGLLSGAGDSIRNALGGTREPRRAVTPEEVADLRRKTSDFVGKTTAFTHEFQRFEQLINQYGNNYSTSLQQVPNDQRDSFMAQVNEHLDRLQQQISAIASEASNIGTHPNLNTTGRQTVNGFRDANNIFVTTLHNLRNILN